MTNSKCKKCGKPLDIGNKCNACKQKEADNFKFIGKVGLAGIGVLLTLAGCAAKMGPLGKNRD